MLTATLDLIAESERLEHNYGDSHEVKEHMLEVTSALAAAERALDEIAARVNAGAFDDSSSALESIGDTLVGTGRNVWADDE